MGGNGGAEVKIEFGDWNYFGSVAPERREVDGNGDADVKIECGGLIEKLTSAQLSGSIQIPQVPRHKRGTDKGYDPTVVSIGPYHHGNKGLEETEKIKVEYLRKLASRDGDDVMAVVDKCLACVQKREEDARRYYSKEISALCSAQFVEMMVLDGCFILELFLSYGFGNTLGKMEVGEMEMGLVYSTRWFPAHVRTDLLLLENQIPYFILEELIQLINDPGIQSLGDSEKKDLLLLLAIYYITGGEFNHRKHLGILLNIRERCPDAQRPVHLLHLYYLFLSQPAPEPRAFKRKWRLPFIQCLLSPCVCFWLCFGRVSSTAAGASSRRRDDSTKTHGRRNIPCAKDLRKALVRFAKKEDTHSFIDVTFRNGTLEIPEIWVEQATEPLLQNLIALEQSRPELEQIFSSYAWLMDNLINTREDVAILENERIVQTNLGSHKGVAIYFNKLCQGQFLDFDNHHFKDIFNELNRHAEEPRNRWGALFMEAYFSSPWVLIAFAAAIFLFAMSLLQTIFTIKK